MATVESLQSEIKSLQDQIISVQSQLEDCEADCKALCAERDDLSSRLIRYQKALEQIREEIPPHKHKEWKHHHHYYYIANTALSADDGGQRSIDVEVLPLRRMELHKELFDDVDEEELRCQSTTWSYVDCDSKAVKENYHCTLPIDHEGAHEWEPDVPADPWNCPDCGQRNSFWATTCGRCEKSPDCSGQEET